MAKNKPSRPHFRAVSPKTEYGEKNIYKNIICRIRIGVVLSLLAFFIKGQVELIFEKKS